MAFMMGGGIGFGAAGIFPEVFIVVFYTGLGCALALAGIAIAATIICASIAIYFGTKKKK